MAAAGRSGAALRTRRRARAHRRARALRRRAGPSTSGRRRPRQYLRGTDLDIEVDLGTGGTFTARRRCGRVISRRCTSRSTRNTAREALADDPKHFLTLLDYTPDDLARCHELALAAELKTARRARAAGRRTPRRSPAAMLGLLFEKPSLRTRVTFTIGVGELGGERRGHSVGCDARRPRAAARRGPQPRTLGGRGGHPHVRAGAAARSSLESAPGLRIVNALSDEEHPVPGARRHADAAASAGARWKAAPSPSWATATTWRPRSCTPALMLGAHMRIATPKGYAPVTPEVAGGGRPHRGAAAPS